MRLSDFELLLRSEPVRLALKPRQPVTSLPHNHSTREGLLYPIMVVSRQGNIFFVNDAAQRLLAEGLDLRLESHVRNDPDM